MRLSRYGVERATRPANIGQARVSASMPTSANGGSHGSAMGTLSGEYWFLGDPTQTLDTEPYFYPFEEPK